MICAWAFAVNGRKRERAPFHVTFRRYEAGVSLRRQRIRGKPVAEVGQSEVEPLRQLESVVERLGPVGKELRHLRGAFQMPLPLGRQQAARLVERRVAADGGHRVVQLLVPRRGVAHAIGGEDGKAQAQRQINESAVAVLLLAQPVPLQLDVEPPRKKRGESGHFLLRRVEAAFPESPGHRPLGAARQAMQPRRVFLDLLERHGRLALRLSQCPGRDQPAKVLVALLVFNQQRQRSAARLLWTLDVWTLDSPFRPSPRRRPAPECPRRGPP